MAWEPKKPLKVETIEVAPPKAGEVRLKVRVERGLAACAAHTKNSIVLSASYLFLTGGLLSCTSSQVMANALCHTDVYTLDGQDPEGADWRPPNRFRDSFLGSDP